MKYLNVNIVYYSAKSKKNLYQELIDIDSNISLDLFKKKIQDRLYLDNNDNNYFFLNSHQKDQNTDLTIENIITDHTIKIYLNPSYFFKLAEHIQKGGRTTVVQNLPSAVKPSARVQNLPSAVKPSAEKHNSNVNKRSDRRNPPPGPPAGLTLYPDLYNLSLIHI